jgi:hypothetical protein
MARAWKRVMNRSWQQRVKRYTSAVRRRTQIQAGVNGACEVPWIHSLTNCALPHLPSLGDEDLREYLRYLLLVPPSSATAAATCCFPLPTVLPCLLQPTCAGPQTHLLSSLPFPPRRPSAITAAPAAASICRPFTR